MAPVPPSPEIIVVSSVEDYRRLARDRVAGGDAVLEIGCSTGKATAVLARTGARVVAIDSGAAVLAKARKALAGAENVRIVRGDARDIGALKDLLPEPDAIFLDIGGTALLDNVAGLVRQCLLAFRPRLIVVRSHELAELACLITESLPAGRPRLRKATPPPRDRALKALLDLSRSRRAANRLFAVRKLRRLRSPAAKRRLTELADDPSPAVRKAAGYRPPARPQKGTRQ